MLEAIASNPPIGICAKALPNLSQLQAAVGIVTIGFSAHQGDLCLMAQVCEVCGRGPRFGNRISHAHNVTKRRWNLNLQPVRALVNGASRRMRVCTSCIRSGKVQKAA
ncbi:MAG TPA: 50S ribosomal protein L28 [Bryobacteraceae bacterium]|nr:50S ribosomal protein L28 [Bryobacteraceae bacterium]